MATVLPASLLPRGELLHGQRANLHAGGGRAGLDFIAVKQHARALGQQPQMAVHRVLVERNEHINFVAHAADGAVAGADGEESVAAADDGLIGVVGVEIESAPREDARENVARRGDALSGFSPDPDCKINFGHSSVWFIRRRRIVRYGLAMERMKDSST